ncbi:MAG TPA: penicillin-binding transpeptidase domain-containing protein [Polyangiaceae bacterium]|nr:penicillin-binding transpeptidase domain-containing protein [Polyangiaceae bacterium]
MTRLLAPLVASALSACSQAAAPAAAPQATGARATVAATPEKAPSGPRELRELAMHFEAERVTGTIALFDTQDGVLGCSDLKRCDEAVVPASTFKIPHSMIALETGVVEGPDTVLPWDHKHYSKSDWNQDLKLRDAFRLSCVPCYMELARKIGEQREREWAEKLDYGNHDTSGGVDKFWLWGGMRISPLQQIDFLRRFDGNELPISERTADMVRDIMTLDVTEKYVLRGKTGSTAPPDEPRELGWFVGWLELGERRVFFATLLDGHAEGVDLIAARRPVTERVLRARGLL